MELRIFEADLAAVHVGDAVEISSPSDPGRIFKCEVGHVGDVVDVDTRSAAVRVVVDNSGSGLRPGQSVHARIHTSAPTGKLPSVPRVAVTRIDGKPTVFVMVAKGANEPVPSRSEPRTPATSRSSRVSKTVKAGGEVEIRLRDEAGCLRVSVTDTGTGIPTDDIPRLFERHWQARRSGRTGLGLGLYISRSIVEAHGGTITVSSKVGEGSTFALTFPIGPAPVDRQTPTPAEDAAAPRLVH